MPKQVFPLSAQLKTMPSGGFIYMDGRQLVRDLRGGLLQLTLRQLGAVQRWVKQDGALLAVGDIVPLLFAWLSGARYAFVGTAKSEYYLRDEAGLLPRRTWRERHEDWAGSVYLPWERWLMSRQNCKAVFPRDSLTTEILQKWSIPAFDLGNPMMDQLESMKPPQLFYGSDADQEQRALIVTLLPGSRAPEAYSNWQQLLMGVVSLLETFPQRSLLFLGAIAPGLSLQTLCQILVEAGFTEMSSGETQILNPQALKFSYQHADLILTQQAYNDCLHLADIAIAMTGTATEQFVGLGKPAITIPGNGPQFTAAFAEAQSRHLGPSVILVEQPTQVGKVTRSLLDDQSRLQLIAENGPRRMGKPGAARSIAACLMEQLG